MAKLIPIQGYRAYSCLATIHVCLLDNSDLVAGPMDQQYCLVVLCHLMGHIHVNSAVNLYLMLYFEQLHRSTWLTIQLTMTVIVTVIFVVFVVVLVLLLVWLVELLRPLLLLHRDQFLLGDKKTLSPNSFPSLCVNVWLAVVDLEPEPCNLIECNNE